MNQHLRIPNPTPLLHLKYVRCQNQPNRIGQGTCTLHHAFYRHELLMIWNLGSKPAERNAGHRSPFAVSRDGSRTWGLPQALESSNTLLAQDPGVMFDGDDALVFHRVMPYDGTRCDLVQARVPIAWIHTDEGCAGAAHH